MTPVSGDKYAKSTQPRMINLNYKTNLNPAARTYFGVWSDPCNKSRHIQHEGKTKETSEETWLFDTFARM